MNANEEFFDSIRYGRIDILKRLIKSGVNVNMKDSQGNTPLHIAIIYLEPNVVNVLLADKNINVNIKDSNGNTPLYNASYDGKIEIVKALIKHKADLNIQNERDETALCVATSYGNDKVVYELLNANPPPDVNIPDNTGKSPLFMASMFGNLDIVIALLEKDANINQPEHYGYTPLHVASEEGYTEVVRTLLQGGANINATTKSGDTPLMMAEREGNADIVILIKEKMGIQEKKWEGFTKSDIMLLDDIFKDNAVDYTLCPVCLEYTDRKDGCMYMHHNCRAIRGGFYHEKLYKKYNYGGEIYWCTICNRIADNHRHYALGRAEDRIPDHAAPPATNVDEYFQGDCRKIGGGGFIEKLARFRRYREYALKLNDDIGNKNDIEARKELVNEFWNAPLDLDLMKETLEQIKESKTWNVNISRFPNTIARKTNNTITENAPDISFNGRLPEITEEIDMIEEKPLWKFFHDQKDESVENHHIVGDVLEGLISNYNKNFGLGNFGNCFEPGCQRKLHPEEVKTVIGDNEVYKIYKGHFNINFKGKTLGGGENVLSPLLDGKCDINAKKGGYTRRKNRKSLLKRNNTTKITSRRRDYQIKTIRHRKRNTKSTRKTFSRKAF